MSTILAFLVALWLGHALGWMDAHATVAKECRLLGKFYVGSTVFKCVEIGREEAKEAEQ